jgi:hypothetical protein
MGQRANSGRNAKLDEKKVRAAGRQQNSPSRKAITDRQEAPPAGGAFGREGKANRRGDRGGTMVTGDRSGSGGGPAAEKVGRSTCPARKRST